MNKMQKKDFLFRGRGVECLSVSGFSKLTAFLFSFFSLTVALFSREWQVAYRTEMSTIMVTAPATHTNTHTHAQGADPETHRGLHTHTKSKKNTHRRTQKLQWEKGSSLLNGLRSASMHALTSASSINANKERVRVRVYKWKINITKRKMLVKWNI